MKTFTFNDAVEYDGAMKAAISVRDGVLEYLGSELGMEPAERIFFVYRSSCRSRSSTSLSSRGSGDEPVAYSWPSIL
jgi:hypothetical protein